MALTSVFDSLGTQPAVLANEALSNSVLSYALDTAGITDRYFEGAYGDGELMRAVKSGVWITGLSLGGRMVRSVLPMLNVFGGPDTRSPPDVGI